MDLGEKLPKVLAIVLLSSVLLAGYYYIYIPIHEASHLSASMIIGSGAKGIDLYSHVKPKPINGAFNVFLFYSAPYIVGLIILLICIKLKSVIKRPWDLVPITFAHFVYFNAIINFVLQFTNSGIDFTSIFKHTGPFYWFISYLIVAVIIIIGWKNRSDTERLYKFFKALIEKSMKN